MSRLIEVQRVEDCTSPLVVRVGDVLLLHASGGRVRSGGAAVELWGPFLPAVIASTGEVLAPTGAPNTVLLRARAPGPATLDMFTGDPWHAPRIVTLSLAVES